MKIIYLILVLSFCYANENAANDNDCDLAATGTTPICNYVSGILEKLNQLQLAVGSCRCFEGVTYQKPNKCFHVFSFRGAPACRKLVYSTTYNDLIESDAVKELVTTMLNKVTYCKHNFAEVENILKKAFTTGVDSEFIENLILESLPLEQAELINACYREIRVALTTDKRRPKG